MDQNQDMEDDISSLHCEKCGHCGEDFYRLNNLKGDLIR